jgi:hypothetical protein
MLLGKVLAAWGLLQLVVHVPPRMSTTARCMQHGRAARNKP